MADVSLVIRGKDLSRQAISSVGSGLKRLEGEAQQLGRRLFNLKNLFVGTAVAGVGLFIEKNLSAVDAIGKVADKIGVTTSELQEYRFAAEQANVSQSALDMGLQRFSRRLGEAAQGKGEILETVRKYNVQLRDSEGRVRANSAVLADFADIIKNAESEQEQLRIAFKLFDSEGAALVNMLKNGSDAMNRVLQEAEAHDSINKVAQVLKTNLRVVVAELSPDIRDVAEHTADWVKQNRELVRQNVKDTAEGIAEGVGRIKSVAERLPSGAVESGLILYLLGRGSALGQVAAGLYLLNEQLGSFNMNLGGITESSREAWDSFNRGALGIRNWVTHGKEAAELLDSLYGDAEEYHRVLGLIEAGVPASSITAQMDLPGLADGLEAFHGSSLKAASGVRELAEETERLGGKKIPPPDTSAIVQSLRDLRGEAQETGEALLGLTETAEEQAEPATYREAMDSWRDWNREILKNQREMAGTKEDLDELYLRAMRIGERMQEIRLGDVSSEAAVAELEDLRAEADEIKDSLAVLAEPHLKLDALNADLREIENAMKSTSTVIERQRQVVIDNEQAKRAVGEVKIFLDSIPDVTYKTVIVEYKTKASPVMPFTEGMAHIREMMDSLPRGQDYVIDFKGLEAVMPLAIQALTARQRAIAAKGRAGIGALAYNPAGQFVLEAQATQSERLLSRVLAATSPAAPNITYSPTFRLDTPWKDLDEYVRQMDAKMAELWLTGRSRLQAAMQESQ
jgi:hypothetical protein